jgi:hypothetical protein
MTQRERHTSDEGAPRKSAAVRPELGQTALGDGSRWDEWYHRASPAQRQEALARAARDGILYAHQLATPGNAATPPRPLLSTLLNDPAGELEPFDPPALEYHDCELDATQREAVARAVATPDICLIQGFPGTGKSRVIAEMILQAAGRGERVLFLAPTPAALDSVLQRLGTRSIVCPVRCLAPDESSDALPDGIARMTLPERVRAYQDDTVPAARAARDAARQACEARLRDQSVWTRLDQLTRQYEQLAERMRVLTDFRAGLRAETDRAALSPPTAGPLRDQWEAGLRTRDKALERLENELAVLQSELDTITGKQGQLESEWEPIRPLAEARQGRRFWTGTWWRALARGGLPEQVRDLETRRAELQSARQRLEGDIAACLAERAEVEDRWTAECERLKDDAITRRQSELDTEIATLSREQDSLREEWRSAGATLPTSSAPAEMSRSALDSARVEWQRQRERQERQAAAAEQWLHAVEEGLRTLPDQLAGCANVVAATTMALPRDAHFGERNGKPAVSFDLLILEEAHRVTESEFAAAARRARRWVLVGEPQADTKPASPPRKVVKPVGLRPGVFQRLWQNLHVDPRRLPFAWSRHEGRLVCRLRSLSAEQEQWIESEPVADRPEIELRILAAPRQSPQVAEVVFPDDMGIGEAKQFVFRELDELAVETRGPALCWSETGEEVILLLEPHGDPHADRVPLEGGVYERVASAGGSFGCTTSLHFARASGWTLERARQWVAERLGLRTLGRTVLLTVPYRLDPLLGRFLSDLLFGGTYAPVRVGANDSPMRVPVEFIAVPSLSSLENRHRAASDIPWAGQDSPSGHGQGRAAVSVRAPRLRTVKGGAGLELDLGDNRPLEHLTADLRAVLPRHGLVNYLEAQAVVRRLEALANDASFLAACTRWRQRRAWPCEHGCAPPSSDCNCPLPDGGPAVAVMALYPAQVELLRHLVRRSPVLSEGRFPVEVGTPAAFHQRECLLALVSLTRSHAHRAVSYGEHPHVLAQALTRATSGLVLVGDPGTLARRSQWPSAVDHLDETAAQQEAALAAQLVQYLQGHGPHPSAFHLHESSGV